MKLHYEFEMITEGESEEEVTYVHEHGEWPVVVRVRVGSASLVDPWGACTTTQWKARQSCYDREEWELFVGGNAILQAMVEANLGLRLTKWRMP